MLAAATIRTQIEDALSAQIPGAFTSRSRVTRPVLPVGIATVDQLLRGGVPVGAITEIAGPECSGRTALALSFVGRMTAAGRVCAWVDVSDAFHPESAAACGVDLSLLLWVRCGVGRPSMKLDVLRKRGAAQTQLSRVDEALRVMGLLLQGGGFNAIVLDMGGILPQDALRIPLATWFRFRAAAERTQACLLALTQHPCAKSSAGLVLGLNAGEALADEATLFTGFSHRLDVACQRVAQDAPHLGALRKPPQRETTARWNSHVSWAAAR